ncbi:filamentous hemagglutinin N-terminal domain-containing protein [uncultured Dialister sp.]|uniref:two-partner secretion domain-containing protein n=1 Tax=uncultured Dialister sp. TaxID=278064 RepID=UPI0026DAC5DA|nr:filamentous hemagglutinin N-terminal domain-containing protein [uncultured Dialister sp.]
MHNYGHWKKTLALLVMSALSLGASSVDAMPEGGVIRSGEGAVSQNGREMTIRQDSGRLAMDWTNFNVGKDETVRFQQPGKDALALNRVTGNQQSIIDGSLLSNGHVLLVNPNGVVIGKNASIDVGGLVASTAHVKDNFMKEFGNSTGAFTLGGVSDGKIINEGTINAEGGLVALHAAKVENSGTITSNGGSVLMAAADTLTLTPDTDGKLNFTVDGKVAEASALNKGAITADGGTIVMTADSASDVMSTVVNNEGTLQARTLCKNEKGQILLEGNDKGQVEVSGTLDASGIDDGQDAGNIKVIGQKTIVHDGTNLLAKGDVNGGKIETSGDVLDLGDNLNIDAKGVNGKAGEWLLDPLDVIIADSDPTGTSNYDGAEKKEASDSDFLTSTGTNTRTNLIGYNDPTATSSNAQDVFNAVTWVPTSIVKTMLEAGTNVRIQAVANNGSANIIVKNNIEKTSGDDATLTLEAMRNITVNGDITASGSNKLNVILNADTNGDSTGAVIINANIKTNGGDFTSASGGKVTYAGNGTAGYGNGTLGGEAEPTGHTVGTYFGHVDESGTADGEKDDRLIQTNGGKITLNGEVAIGLNGGTLTLDSSSTDGTKGDITVTGIINSGNSYGAYVYGTTIWDELTQTNVDEYLANGKIPAYHYQGINYQRKRVVKTDENGNPVTDANGNLVYATDANGNPIYEKDANGNYVYLTDDNGNYIVSTEKEYYTGAETHYTFTEQDSENVRWPSDGTSTSVSTGAGYGYSSVIVSKGRMTTKEYLQYLAVSDPDSFLAKYMVSGATISIGGTNYTLARGTKSGVNYLGYKQGNNVVQLTTTQLQDLARDAATRAQNKADTTVMKNGSSAYTNLEDNIRRLLASNWYESEKLARYDKDAKTYNNGKSAVGDSYLATITTVLENSLTTPNGQQILWAGGMGSGVRNKKGTTTTDKQNPYSWYGLPDDPTHQNGMYWVTGPEGKVTNSDGTKGTQFYSNVGSDWNASTPNYGETVYGYANWDTYKSGGKIRYQPDNSAPFLTVGYGTTGKWDDAAFGGDTTIGFVKETNLANSSLNIKAGSGAVSLGGDIGKAKALDTVNIESTGAVTIGTDNNNVTDYYHGTVYVDHGLYISGNGVTVGGEIHSGESEETDTSTTLDDKYKDSVTIESAGNIEVHGITSNTYDAPNTDGTTTTRGGKISLTSTGNSGKITLGAGVDYDGNATAGTLAAASAEKGAVIVDAQGTHGAFINSTNQEASAIKTGETTDADGNKVKGTWLIYSASPDKDTFGTNLDSKTDAEWTSKSSDKANNTNSSGKKMHVYDTTDLTHTTNKYIFQVQPVITVSGADTTKTYGVEWGTDELKKLISYSASYVNSDNTPIDVATGKDQAKNAFTNAFTELDYKNYISNADGTKIGESNISYDSLGKKKTADRENGDKTDANGKPILATSDKAQAIYNLSVKKAGDDVTGIHGYDVITKDGSIEITKRKVTINQDGTITYGSNQGIAYEVPTSENATDITGLTNGDTIGSVTMTTSKEYQDSKGTRNTGDAGKYDLTTDGTNTHIVNNGKDVSVNYDISGSGTLTVEKATLTLDTGSTTKDYGDAAGVKDFLTDKEENYTLDGFVNGDENDTDKQNTIRGYIGVKNKSKALRDESHTNDVLNGGNSGYAIDTVATPNANLKNYNVVVKKGNTVTLKPVDINIYAEGNGSTLSDVTWTKIEKDKLVNGDSWDNFTFRVEPGDLISYADKTFGIKGYVHDQLISDGTQIGNYIYHPTGIVQLTFNPIVKPDVWAHSGGYRPRNKIETSLPVFRVEDAKVGQYGTYGVEHREDEDKLVLSATGMRLPEPDQVPDEERTFTTTLSTEEGSGTFKLEYNGVSLKVHPQDKKAEEVVRAGDKTKNVSLSEKALYVGYTEMGLDLIDLRGVYIYFN